MGYLLDIATAWQKGLGGLRQCSGSLVDRNLSFQEFIEQYQAVYVLFTMSDTESEKTETATCAYQKCSCTTHVTKAGKVCRYCAENCYSSGTFWLARLGREEDERRT